MINSDVKFTRSSLKFNTQKFKSIISLYFYTLGTILLGFAAYLFYTLNNKELLSEWIGGTFFWSFIIFFASIFVLFLPSEFFNYQKIQNDSFNDLIINIVFIIFVSLFFLIFFQIMLNVDNLFIKEVQSITRSISFSGFITVPLALFVIQNFSKKISIFKNYSYLLILFVWIMSSQLFL